MANSMTVVVLCPNARRQTVKVSPNSSILEVLEEACKKQGIDPSDYDVRHYNRRLDLSLSVRFANLPNNALLELKPVEKVRSETSITVALQLESGERVVSDFSSSSSLQDIVESYLRTSTSEAAEAGEPVCIYMRQQFVGDQLKTTTLRSLGLTGGKTIIRLMYRPLETLSEQAHVSAPLPKPKTPYQEIPNSTTRKYMASAESNDSVKQPRLDPETGAYSDSSKFESSLHAIPKDEGNITAPANSKNSRMLSGEAKENMQTGEQLASSVSKQPSSCQGNGKTFVETCSDSEVMDCETSGLPEEIGEIKFLGPRNAILFNLDDISEVRRDDFPVDFFDLTLHDVQYLVSDYKRIREELENEPLMLKSQKEARFLQQFACYKQTVIRVYFPDKLVLQGTFIVEETVQAVKDFVRDYLQDRQQDFYLYITPPKTKLSTEKTLLEARLVPAAVVYFGSDKPCNGYLHNDYRDQISDPRAAWKVAAQHRQKSESDVVLDKCVEFASSRLIDNRVQHVPTIPSSQQPEQEAETYTPITFESQGVRPKWFNLGKK